MAILSPRQKFRLGLAIAIIGIFIWGYGLPAARCDWKTNNNNTVYQVKSAIAPVIDGIKNQTIWDSIEANTEDVTQPLLDFRMIYNGSMIYCVITVRNDTHSLNESVMLLLSNNGSTFKDAKYFVDAKYLDINNVSYDQRLSAGEYRNDDTDQNITGKVSFENITNVKNWTVYEMGFSFNNSNTEWDLNWTFGNEYLVKIRVGDAVTKQYVEYMPFTVKFGLTGGATDDTVNPLNIDPEILRWVIFSSIAGVYAALGIYIAISKKRIIQARGTEPPVGTGEPVKEEVEEETGEE